MTRDEQLRAAFEAWMNAQTPWERFYLTKFDAFLAGAAAVGVGEPNTVRYVYAGELLPLPDEPDTIAPPEFRGESG